MNSELYSAASGLIVEERRVDAIANNLANASTAGFRARRLFSTMYEAAAPGTVGATFVANHQVAIAGSYQISGPGPRRPTDRLLDVALDARDLLVVDTGRGRGYTRNGALAVTHDGVLTDGAGNPVLGAGGQPIRGLSAAATISAGGEIFENGAALGSLLVVRDPEGVLEPLGSGLETAADRDDALETVTEPVLQPGYLEGSTTDPVNELVRLLEAQRAFESYQRLISMTMNDVNRKTVSEIAG